MLVESYPKQQQQQQQQGREIQQRKEILAAGHNNQTLPATVSDWPLLFLQTSRLKVGKESKLII